jgi:hypothetical protein
MGKRIEHQRMTVDGREMVMLDLAEFERLDASRRQIGPRQASIAWLRQQLDAANTRIADLENQLAEQRHHDAVSGTTDHDT